MLKLKSQNLLWGCICKQIASIVCICKQIASIVCICKQITSIVCICKQTVCNSLCGYKSLKEIGLN